jgi:chromosomal replication initiation ATPase DnaA
MRGRGERIKGDERILGDGDFVESVLKAGNERLERRAGLRAAGYDFDRLVERVAALFEMPSQEVLREGRFVRTVAARSVLCYWANRELGVSTVELAQRLNIAQSTVTQSVKRGEKIAAEKRLIM